MKPKFISKWMGLDLLVFWKKTKPKIKGILRAKQGGER
jgi:hypothetical protein